MAATISPEQPVTNHLKQLRRNDIEPLGLPSGEFDALRYEDLAAASAELSAALTSEVELTLTVPKTDTTLNRKGRDVQQDPHSGLFRRL
jgi:hypothetical protein